MKKITFITTASAMLLFFIAANTAYVSNASPTRETATASSSFTATIAGKPYTGKINHATQTLNYQNSGNNILTVESFGSPDAADAPSTQSFVLLVHFTGDKPAEKAYSFEAMVLGKPFSSTRGSYSDGSNHYSFDPARGGSGSIAFSSVDEGKGLVSGTFSGTAVNGPNKVSITNGRFNNLTIFRGK